MGHFDLIQMKEQLEHLETALPRQVLFLQQQLDRSHFGQVLVVASLNEAWESLSE